MSTNLADHEERERTARNEKIEQYLLPAWERYVETVLDRPIDPLGADVRIVRDLARSTISTILREHPHRTRAQDKALLPKRWHELADHAGLPAARHPSVTTIEKLVARLDRRVDEVQRDPFTGRKNNKAAA